MKFSHKVAKLAQPLTYRRAWRRAERIIHPVPLTPIFSSIDQAKLAEIQAQYASSKEHYAKYTNVKRWLRLNIVRAQDLKFIAARPSPSSILAAAAVSFSSFFNTSGTTASAWISTSSRCLRSYSIFSASSAGSGRFNRTSHFLISGESSI